MSKTRLDHDDRINLQAGIAKGYSLSMISKILNKSRSTIYREIINNSYYKDSRHTCAHCKLNCKNKDHYKNGECQYLLLTNVNIGKSFLIHVINVMNHIFAVIEKDIMIVLMHMQKQKEKEKSLGLLKK